MKLLQIWFDHWSILTTWYAVAQNCWSINEVRNHLDWSTYYFVDNFFIWKKISILGLKLILILFKILFFIQFEQCDWLIEALMKMTELSSIFLRKNCDKNKSIGWVSEGLMYPVFNKHSLSLVEKTHCCFPLVGGKNDFRLNVCY